MNPTTSIRGNHGFLFVYTVIATIVGVGLLWSLIQAFIAPNTLNIVTDIILLVIACAALFTLFKKSPNAVLLNKIYMTVISLFYLYKTVMLIRAYNMGTEMPFPIFVFLLIITALAPFLVTAGFFIYWFLSKRVKNTFTLQTPIIDPSAVPLPPSATESASRTLSRVFFSVVIIFSSFMFLFTGWGALFLIPFTFVFSCIYVTLFNAAFTKYQTSTSTIYSILVSTLCAYVSLLINEGIATDAPTLSYLIPSLMGIPDQSFQALFGTLYLLSLVYFLCVIIIEGIIVKKGRPKSLAIILPIVGLLLIGIHVGKVLIEAPALKVEVKKTREAAVMQEEKRVDDIYAFDIAKITEQTFKNRVFSVFTPPLLPTGTAEKNCVYLQNTLMKIVEADSTKTLDFQCLNDYVSSLYKLPVSQNGRISFVMKTDGILKKGDVFVFVAELPKNTYLWINAEGNAAMENPGRMPPYDYEGVTESANIGDTTYYARSVLQVMETDKTRTEMVFYPINTDGLTELEVNVSTFAGDTTSLVSLKEIGVIKPKFEEPAWLREWSKKPNPFLKKK